MLGEKSLRGLPIESKINFIDLYPNDINEKFPTLSENVCKAENGQRFYTLANGYKHPSYIVVSPSKILSVGNPAFECKKVDGEETLALLSVDDDFLASNSSITIDGDTIGCISGLSSDKIETISFVELSNIVINYESTIAENTFDSSSNPNLKLIYALGISYKGHEDSLSGFWTYTSNRNEQLTVVFADGDIIHGEFIENDDPFLKKNIDDELVIYGIANTRVKTSN